MVGTFADDQFKSVGDALEDGKQRIQEGKILDAVYNLGADQLSATSSNAAKAVNKSPLLNQMASAAANAYGGPSGAAAYAAWLAYETTGDFEAAMRAGALAGASSYAKQVGGDMPEEVRHEMANFSVNASAIAASGGSSDEVMKALNKQVEEVMKKKLQASAQEWITDDVMEKIGDKKEIASALNCGKSFLLLKRLRG